MNAFSVEKRSTRSHISPGFSLYLDVIRFLAAVSVVLYHTWAVFMPDSHLRWPGHEAVVIFFVLSGYVITHAVAQPSVTLGQYVQHRAARILPVALMALLLAYPLAAFLIPSATYTNVAVPTLANALFVAQSGWLAVEAPLNPPFWSLNYEVWYYVIFGTWMFSSARWRTWLTLLAALCAGPKILLLMPVWIMGSVLYHRMPRLSNSVAWIVLLITIVLGCVMWLFDVSDILRNWLYQIFPPAWRAHYSTQFIYDNLLGVIVSAHFAAVSTLGGVPQWMQKGAHVIRYLASFTFSIYVFHSPLLEFLTKVTRVHSPMLFYTLMALCVFLLAQLTERRVKFFRALLASIGGRRRAHPTT